MSPGRIGPILASLSLLVAQLLAAGSPSPPASGWELSHYLRTGTNEFQAGWTEVTTPVHPPAVAGSMMTYDTQEGVFVLFGGSVGHPINETWIFDPETLAWSQVQPAVSPPARADGMLVYDTRTGAVVLFGGWYETPEYEYRRWADTWAFYVPNRTWVELHPTTSPPPRSDSAVAYDESEGIVLLFGGFNEDTYLGDMWSYAFSSNTWVPRSSPTMPSARADGRMAYDPHTRSYFLFSGNDYSDPSFNFHHLADMWQYRWLPNEWTHVFPDDLPMPRTYAVLENDLQFGELLMTGGYGNRTVLGDIWAFNTTRFVWRNITTPGGPSPRIAAVGGYDFARGIFVVFGGGDDTSVKADTWVFRYPPPLVGNIFMSKPDPRSGETVGFISDIQGGSGSLDTASWDFGDGNTASGRSAVHAFDTPGVYEVRFVAMDDRGASFERTISVSVGLLLPFWLDVAMIVVAVAVSLTLILAILLVRRYRRRSP